MNGTSKSSFMAGLRRSVAPPLSVGKASVGAVLVGALVVGAGTLGGVAGGAGWGSLLSRGAAVARAAELAEASTAQKKPPDEVLRILEERQRKAEEQGQLAREAQRHLKLLQAELAKRLELLRKERKELLKLVSRIEQREEGDISHLANSLAETPPERAGLILGELDAELAAAILKRMSKRKAGRVWGHLKADRAASISRVLARRQSQLAGLAGKKDEATEAKSPKAPRKLLPPSLSIK